jgi:hypothetical protein
MKARRTSREAGPPPRRWGRAGLAKTTMRVQESAAQEQVGAGPPSRTVDTFFGGLARRLGLPAGADLVFGERVEHDGVVVIPVAKAAWGMGGGVDAAKDAGGGGGGAMFRPFGYVQISGGTARFHRILSPLNAVGVIVAGTVGAALVLRALGRLLAGVRSGRQATGQTTSVRSSSGGVVPGSLR